MESTIVDYIAFKDYGAKLALATGNPTELLSYLKQYPCKQGLYILDIDLQHKINGILLAAKIREIDVYGTIIFVTTHADLSHLTFRYKVEVMDYITKGDAKHVTKRVRECIDIVSKRHLDNQLLQKSSYQLKIGSKIRLIPLEDIMFFYSIPNTPGKIILYTQNGRLEFYGSLNEIAQANPDFYRSHKSFVVNSKNIKSIDTSKKELEMINGSTAFIAVRKVTALTKLLTQQP
jgi:two-component system response regulator AgrA